MGGGSNGKQLVGKMWLGVAEQIVVEGLPELLAKGVQTDAFACAEGCSDEVVVASDGVEGFCFFYG